MEAETPVVPEVVPAEIAASEPKTEATVGVEGNTNGSSAAGESAKWGATETESTPEVKEDNAEKSTENGSSSKYVTEDGEWKCDECGNLNYHHRRYCNMRKCGAPRDGRDSRGSRKRSSRDSDDDRGSKRSRKEDNDWKCGECGNMNFGYRAYCNMRKCGAPRQEWLCDCGNWNYSFRSHCNLRRCGRPRPYERPHATQNGYQTSYPQGPPGGSYSSRGPPGSPRGDRMHTQPRPPPRGQNFRPGDWNCPDCGNFNFANRDSCNMRKCGAPRPPNYRDERPPPRDERPPHRDERPPPQRMPYY